VVQGTGYFFRTSTYYSLKYKLKSLGDLCDSGTPGHISNPVVKAVSADGTRGVTLWESRSLPRGFFYYLTVVKNSVIIWSHSVPGR
jgi:hypothetical protein